MVGGSNVSPQANNTNNDLVAALSSEKQKKENICLSVGTVSYITSEIARPGVKHTHASIVYSFSLFLYKLAQ